jgi:predicted secreted Zn-dependent protease
MSDWWKSTFSAGNGCVEVAVNSAAPIEYVWMRDSKDKGEGPILKFTATEWQAFLAGVRGGEFDLPSG